MRAKDKQTGQKSSAFTLAEVLITLGIIGIVAALTIPSLMQKNQDQTTVSKLKKVYSTLSNAYTMALKDNGPPNTWGFSGTSYNVASSQIMMDRIAPYLNIQKDCGIAAGCFPNVTYKLLNDTNWANLDANGRPHVILQDGTLLASIFESGNCDIVVGSTPALSTFCGSYDVDINGNAGPNKVGVDLFRFFLTNFGILPKGVQGQTADQTFEANCRTSGSGVGSGFGCTAWIIYNGNMDYAKCPSSLSWSGAKTCP